MAVGAVLFVLGWRLCVVWWEPAHQRAVAAELMSVPVYMRHMIYPSHTGSGLVYGRKLENTVGLFFCNPTTHKSRLISENNPNFYGWSPDDGRFAYGVELPQSPGKWAIVICDGHTGEQLAQLVHPGFPGSVVGYLMPDTFAWLSSQSFTFFTNGAVGVVEQKSDGIWRRAKTISITAVKPSGLTACSSGTVAWKDGNAIKTLDLATEKEQEIWNSSTNQLEDFVGAPDGSDLLLKCVDDAGQYLLRCSWKSRDVTPVGRIDPAHRGVFRLHSVWNDHSPTFISWDGSRPSTVYLSDDGLNEFHINEFAGKPGQILSWGGGVMVHSCLAGKHLFIAGHPATDWLGIWDYDASQNRLTRIVPEETPHFKYARYVPPDYGSLTNGNGQKKGYSLWHPVSVQPGRKYPLIIGQTANGDWFPIEQAAANNGCFFAVVHRPYWICRSLYDWPTDVTALSEVLKQNPNIDTNRIYVWATSAELGGLGRLLDTQSNWWKGVIVFSPGGPLHLPNSMNDKTVYVIAGDETEDARAMKEYQNHALSEGILLKLYLEKDKEHSPNHLGAERERVEIFEKLCEDL